PKANGYRALHLTAMGPDGKWIEVQIRSRKMDEIAELGYAAHWKYKSGVKDKEDDSQLDKWMDTVKDILANPEPNAIDFLDTIKLNLFASEIYVFTPKGDLIRLPSGATVLDMAYAIHTHLGNHCVAGKIAHRLVPPSYRLGSGDQVEIITSASQTPQESWLEHCRTAKSQNRVRAWLRREKREVKGRDAGKEGLGKRRRKRPGIFRLTGKDRHGILQDICSLISGRMGMNIRELNISTTGGVFECQLGVMLDGARHEEIILAGLREIEGITEVNRKG
ncbi:MAG: TGS domain-containing protein, partial [Muribaculaceae bacterium]|nr:TGS domain-containing protein [Muribaculaceae bacterium]